MPRPGRGQTASGRKHTDHIGVLVQKNGVRPGQEQGRQGIGRGQDARTGDILPPLEATIPLLELQEPPERVPPENLSERAVKALLMKAESSTCARIR